MRSVVISVSLAFIAASIALAQEAGAPEKFSIWLPARPWALELEAPGFIAKTNEIQRDGRRYFLAESGTTGMIASVFLESMKGPAQPDECERSLRDKERRNSSLSLNGLKGVVYRQSGVWRR